MPTLAVGWSRPLCLEAALAHVTLHTDWQLCPRSPTPVKCWWRHQGRQHRQHCHRSHQTCTRYRDAWTHWPGLNSGLLRGEHEPETHTTNFPNSGIHISASEAHPSGEAVWREEHSTEKTWRQRGNSHFIIWWMWKESNLSSLHGPLLPNWVQPPSQSQQVFTSCPTGRGRNVYSMVLRAMTVETEDLRPQRSPPWCNLMWKSKYAIHLGSGLPKTPATASVL